MYVGALRQTAKREAGAEQNHDFWLLKNVLAGENLDFALKHQNIMNISKAGHCKS